MTIENQKVFIGLYHDVYQKIIEFINILYEIDYFPLQLFGKLSSYEDLYIQIQPFVVQDFKVVPIIDMNYVVNIQLRDHSYTRVDFLKIELRFLMNISKDNVVNWLNSHTEDDHIFGL